MASLVKRSTGYYAQFFNQQRCPKRKQVALGTSRKRAATQALRRLEDAYASGEFDPWLDDPHTFERKGSEPEPSSEVLAQFLQRKEQQGRSENTINSYRWLVGKLIERAGDPPIDTLQTRHVRDYVWDDFVSAGTRQARYRHVRVFLRWAKKNSALQRSLLEGVEAPTKSEKLPRQVTVSDLQAICSTLREDYERKLEGVGCSEGELIWHIPLFWFAMYTGMRVSELARLRWKDIDFEHELIYIRRQKNRKEQTIPLNSKARSILEKLEDERTPAHYVFNSPDGPKEARSIRTWCQNVSKTFSRFREKSGINRPITFHGLRHGFCTLLAEAGKNAATIQAAARHEDIATSMQYVHLTNGHLKSELEDVFG